MDNLEKMGVMFTHPDQLFYNVGRNLIMNCVDIYHLIETALSDQKQGWYFPAGKAVGEATSLLFYGGEENIEVFFWDKNLRSNLLAKEIINFLKLHVKLKTIL